MRVNNKSIVVQLDYLLKTIKSFNKMINDIKKNTIFINMNNDNIFDIPKHLKNVGVVL